MSDIFDPTFERYLTIVPTGKNLRGFIYLKPVLPPLIINEPETINTILDRHEECMDIKIKTTRKGSTSWWVEMYALANKYTVSKTSEKLQVAKQISFPLNIEGVEFLVDKKFNEFIADNF